MDPNRSSLSVALLLNRLSMGLFLLIAGIGKVAGGVGNFYDYFFTLTPDWLPHAVATPYAYAIPFLEIVFGALLVLGLFTRISAWVSFAMILSYTIALIIHNGSIKYGPGPFSANFIMLTLVFTLGIAGSGWISIDRLLRKKRG